MKKFTFIIIILTVITACKNTGKEYIKLFNSTKKIVNNDLTDHFPITDFSKNHYILSIKSPVNSEYNEGLELTAFIKEIKEKINKISDSLEKVSYKIVNINDSCLLMIDRPYKIKNRGIDRCQNESVPLPNFGRWDDSFSTNKMFIPDDLKFYILDAKPGEFLPDSLLTKGGGLPKKWLNGFTKGISISKKENVIVYWLAVW